MMMVLYEQENIMALFVVFEFEQLLCHMPVVIVREQVVVVHVDVVVENDEYV
jgi:hypothetical protein